MAILIIFSGCRTARTGGPEDPALSALGRASMAIMAERMNGPLSSFPLSGPEELKLGKSFALDGVFEGPASEAALALSKAMGYGLSVKNARAGELRVTIVPSGQGRSILWLISDLNRQLKKDRASLWVDTVNRRLVLSASEVGG
ncbi:MAG: hypothetical protein LBJ61_04310 [Deltaproteobacteria bacterium]|nr:hypothetical protein [Deltaproteobacteria bacterium]